MSQARGSRPEPAVGREARVQQVLDECLRRRASAEALPDDQIIAAHPELLPELQERLTAMNLIERARSEATESVAGPSGPFSHVEGHCPYCQTHWRLRAEHAGRRARCRNCGQTFAALPRTIDSSSISLSSSPVAIPNGAPEAIPGYEIQDELGRGGMGRVFRATELATKRTVALKVMLAGRHADERQRRRFEREVEIAAALQHPHVARLYASGLHEGHYWFAMEYVPGAPLDAYVAQEHPALRDLLALFARICQAVNHAHQRGIMHRDLKPGNILVDEHAQPHVLDFGLAKTADHLAALDQESISMPGEIAGTPAYMSPEQTKGDPGQIDIRSDVYSLGVVLYRLLTGHSPYGDQQGIGGLFKAINEIEPAPPRKRRPDLPVEINAIVLKALRKDPARRYQTAGELGRDVEAYLAGDAVAAMHGSGWYALRKLGRRYRGAAAAVAAVVVFSLGLGITMSALFAKTVTEYRDVVREVQVIREREAARRDVPGDESTLRRMAQEYWGAWRERNPTPLERWQALLADDFVMSVARGSPGRGKSTAIDWYRNKRPAEIAQFRPGTAFMDYAVESIRLLGDGGVVFGKITFGGRLKDASKDVRQQMWETLVFRRDPPGWRIVHEATALPQDAPAPAPASNVGAAKPATPSNDNKPFRLTFRTAEPAPTEFDAWSFWCTAGCFLDAGAHVERVILEPNGKEHRRDTVGAIGFPGPWRSDFSDSGDCAVDPRVFAGRPITVVYEVSEGRPRFGPGAEFSFCFYRRPWDRERPFRRIPAIVEPKDALELLSKDHVLAVLPTVTHPGGREGNQKIARAYTEDCLKLWLTPQCWAIIGGALYDAKRYEDALPVFEALRKETQGVAVGQLVATTWRGHLLDLLGRRAAAVDAYTQAAALDTNDVLEQPQYRFTFSTAYARARLTEPFQRVENHFGTDYDDTPYAADFNSGAAPDWELGGGWELVEENPGNFVLHGTRHTFAKFRYGPWQDYVLRARVKLIRGNLNINVREGGPGHRRYFVVLEDNHVELHTSTFPPQEHRLLVEAKAECPGKQWHTVEVGVKGGQVVVSVNGTTVIRHEDPKPHPAGGISFETDNDPEAYVDDVSVTPIATQ